MTTLHDLALAFLEGVARGRRIRAVHAQELSRAWSAGVLAHGRTMSRKRQLAAQARAATLARKAHEATSLWVDADRIHKLTLRAGELKLGDYDWMGAL